MRSKSAPSLAKLKQEIRLHQDKTKAAILQRFFKTGPGQYGEGDVFLGLTVPLQRQIAKQYRHLPVSDLARLLKSNIHEFRLMALIILTDKYQAEKNEKKKDQLARFYLSQVGRINNWDLVDLSAPKILGDFLFRHPEKRQVLIKLAHSKDLWSRRIALLATFQFIVRGRAEETLSLAAELLHDSHDLIHKALGWMLREVGKRVDKKLLTDFLDKHAPTMPRTSLRYAIERLNPAERASYLKRV